MGPGSISRSSPGASNAGREVALGRGQGWGLASSGSRSRWRAMAAATALHRSGARGLLKAKRPSPELQRRPASKENIPWVQVTHWGSQQLHAGWPPVPSPVAYLVGAEFAQEAVRPAVEHLRTGSPFQLDGVLAQHHEVGALQLAAGSSLASLHQHWKLVHWRQAARVPCQCLQRLGPGCTGVRPAPSPSSPAPALPSCQEE